MSVDFDEDGDEDEDLALEEYFVEEEAECSRYSLSSLPFTRILGGLGLTV